MTRQHRFAARLHDAALILVAAWAVVMLSVDATRADDAPEATLQRYFEARQSAETTESDQAPAAYRPPQDVAAVACGVDAVCLALMAKDYESCETFEAGVLRGWYPLWATDQTGVCAETERGDVLYGFTGPTDRGYFDFYVMSPRGVICRGGGYRSPLAVRDPGNLDGAASFVCSNGQVGTAEFGADQDKIVGTGRFLRSSNFALHAFDMRGAAPSIFPPPPEKPRGADDASRQKDNGISH